MSRNRKGSRWKLVAYLTLFMKKGKQEFSCRSIAVTSSVVLLAISQSVMEQLDITQKYTDICMFVSYFAIHKYVLMNSYPRHNKRHSKHHVEVNSWLSCSEFGSFLGIKFPTNILFVSQCKTRGNWSAPRLVASAQNFSSKLRWCYTGRFATTIFSTTML